MCSSVLQCVATCCSVLQRVVVCRSVLQCVAVCCSVLQCDANVEIFAFDPIRDFLMFEPFFSCKNMLLSADHF